MRFAFLPPRETYIGVAWVSHVKVDRRELLEESERQGLSDLRHTVHHLEVFKKPSTVGTLPADVYGSTMTGFTLEEGKEFLLCGSITEDGRLSCVGGQIRPEGVEGMVAEWREIKPEFIEEMKTFEHFLAEYEAIDNNVPDEREGHAPTRLAQVNFPEIKLDFTRQNIAERACAHNWAVYSSLYWVDHIEKPATLPRLPTEKYSSFYSEAILRARVGGEYLVCGGGSYSTANGEVPSREDETRMLEEWADLTNFFIDEMRFYLASHPQQLI